VDQQNDVREFPEHDRERSAKRTKVGQYGPWSEIYRPPLHGNAARSGASDNGLEVDAECARRRKAGLQVAERQIEGYIDVRRSRSLLPGPSTSRSDVQRILVPPLIPARKRTRARGERAAFARLARPSSVGTCLGPPAAPLVLPLSLSSRSTIVIASWIGEMVPTRSRCLWPVARRFWLSQ